MWTRAHIGLRWKSLNSMIPAPSYNGPRTRVVRHRLRIHLSYRDERPG